MSYNKIGNRVPVYALYGVPEDEAYGRANGGIPTAEAYSTICQQSTESLNNSTKNQTGKQNNNSKICSYFQNSNNNSQSLSILPREENSYVANIKDNQNTANAFTPQTNNFSSPQQDNSSHEQQSNVSAIIPAQNNIQQTPSNYIQEIRKLLNKDSTDVSILSSQDSNTNTTNNEKFRPKQNSNLFNKQKQLHAENSVLADFLALCYGANRSINGLTFGGLDTLGKILGFDSQMTDYLKLMDREKLGELTRDLGIANEYAANILSASKITSPIVAPIAKEAQVAYNSYKIGKAYDKFKDNPFQGKSSDVITKMKDADGEKVLLQRGNVIEGNNGEIIVAGNPLKRITGSGRNYGLVKGIFKHKASKEQSQSIPKILRRKPDEISPRNQKIYVVQTPEGEFKIVTTPINGERTISSFYIIDRY